jgi:BASS family bile acid:Na+ symporter
LPPVLAVGMLLLAASPGGTTANLYSHLFRGDVALNISLTAINSVLAVFTLPLITNLAIAYFLPGDDSLGLQLAKVVEVFIIVLGPVVLGMLARWWRPSFADRMDRPVRIASVVILVVVIAGAIASNLELLLENAGRLAGVTVVFCVLSLTVGYMVPRLLRVDRRQSIASSFEIGIHNATLAIVIAQTVIGSVEMSLPAAVYGVLMFFVALAFGFLIRGRGAGTSAGGATDATATSSTAGTDVAAADAAASNPLVADAAVSDAAVSDAAPGATRSEAPPER